jgi:Family of unknown function (DUF6011)
MNTNNYDWDDEGPHFADPGGHGGQKSRVGREAPSAKAFDWAWRALTKGTMPANLEVWHEGRCGRCGRKLTVPESIARGIGPECAGRMAS